MATALDLLMSTKEDVNLLSEESDICTIDAKTRAIFVPSTIVVGGVQSDKNAERIKFSCPKIVGDNLDLSKFSVRINFENVSSVDFNVSIKDQYICDDVAVDGENVTFSWLIGRNAARYMGTVRFIVCAVKTDSDSNISVEWNTAIAEVPVLEGIEIDQPQIGQEEKDVINQLLELTKNTSAEAVQNVNSAKEQAIKDIQSVSQPDTTLTIEGGLAEAKATGEAIGSLKEEIVELGEVAYRVEHKKRLNIPTGSFDFFFPTFTGRKYRIINEGTTGRFTLSAYNNDTRVALISENGVASGTSVGYEPSTNGNKLKGYANTDTVIYAYDEQSLIDEVNSNKENITFLKNESSRIAENIIDLETRVNGVIHPTWIDGYIDPSGHMYSGDTSWVMTKPFKAYRGVTLKFTANGYGKNLCSMISIDNGTDHYTVVAKSNSGNVETYEYTFSEDAVVVLSCVKTSSSKDVSISYDTVEPSFSMFEHWGVIGDSFASGVYYDSEKGKMDNHLQKSWGQILARQSGNTCVNFSMGGLYCGDWLTNNDRGLPFLLRESAKELYIVALGINDVSRLSSVQPLGSIADINNDFSQNPNTFYGNYGKIIGNIKSHAPKAKIIMSTIPYTFSDAMIINNAIIAIAEHYELPCLMVHADKFFRSKYYWDNFEQDHPKSFMYGATANAYERLICDSLKNDTSYWGDTFN